MRGGKPAHTFDGVLLVTAKQLAFFFFVMYPLSLTSGAVLFFFFFYCFCVY